MRWLGSSAHADWLAQQSAALLAFGAGSRVDRGFGYLDAAGDVDAARPLELYANARMTHCFAIGSLLGRPEYGPLADHGLRALRTTFADTEHGGWFATVSAAGVVVDATKQAYAHAFVILAAASATAAGRESGSALLHESLAVAERHFWCEPEGAVLEGWDRAFTHAEAYRGANANMHTVEAYLAATDVTGDPVWLERALRIAELVVDTHAREHGWRLPEHFTPAWQPVLDHHRDEPAHPFRPFGATVGHWLEWARLLLHVREGLIARELEAAGWLLDAARALFDQAVADGWAVDGAEGLVYTVDFAGAPVVHERMHWVVCEALGAAAALHAVTGEERYARWYQRWWEHAAAAFIEAPGRWHHELDRDNAASTGTWSGKPDIYHALQATLIPRLPLAPALAPALAQGLLDQVAPAR